MIIKPLSHHAQTLRHEFSSLLCRSPSSYCHAFCIFFLFHLELPFYLLCIFCNFIFHASTCIRLLHIRYPYSPYLLHPFLCKFSHSPASCIRAYPHLYFTFYFYFSVSCFCFPLPLISISLLFPARSPKPPCSLSLIYTPLHCLFLITTLHPTFLSSHYRGYVLSPSLR